MTPRKINIGIVGAGLAGLSCAHYLEKLGYSPVIFEKDTEIGGRCRTDIYEGYLLDRGFQVLLSSYAEVKKIVRIYEMDVKPFPSGATVYDGNQWYPLYNPLKHPFSIFELRNIPFAYFADYVKMGSIYIKSSFRTGSPFFRSIGKTTMDFWKEEKLSEPFINKFLRPFFAGVFLDTEMTVNPGIFQWLLHFFVEGSAVLPRKGMGYIPKAFAETLKKTDIRLNQPVKALEGKTIYLDNHQEFKCDKIVVALDAPQAKALFPTLPELKSKSTSTLYFAIDTAAFSNTPSSLLHLNGTSDGPINNLAFPSLVQPSYSPKGKILASASIVSTEWQNNPNLIQAAKEQLSSWFKIPVDKWELLKRYTIPHALPDQKDPPPLQGNYAIGRSPDIYICGEYTDNASLNGACASGRKAAEALHASLTEKGF
ncbi:MAG: NAD(P)/FAD-dependent oxidoreductase [Parachlamydiales bacterium]|jgi:protoporphyrinogen oxidase